MPESRSGKSSTCIMIGLAACWFMSSRELAAQSAPTVSRVLVVVTDAADAACVKRIGAEHVRVELLFACATGASASEYEVCDERVRGLVTFELFVSRDDSYCPSECFWRDRMSAANPQGQVYRLSQSRRCAATDFGHGIQRAIDIHRALASVLPEHQESLDAELKAELQRLRTLRLRSRQLALGE